MTRNKNSYLFSKGIKADTLKNFIGNCIVLAVLSLLCELFKFLKWYTAVQNRIAPNPLSMMLNEVLPCANPFNEQEMAIMNNDKEDSFQGEGG